MSFLDPGRSAEACSGSRFWRIISGSHKRPRKWFTRYQHSKTLWPLNFISDIKNFSIFTASKHFYSILKHSINIYTGCTVKLRSLKLRFDFVVHLSCAIFRKLRRNLTVHWVYQLENHSKLLNFFVLISVAVTVSLIISTVRSSRLVPIWLRYGP